MAATALTAPTPRAHDPQPRFMISPHRRHAPQTSRGKRTPAGIYRFPVRSRAPACPGGVSPPRRRNWRAHQPREQPFRIVVHNELIKVQSLDESFRHLRIGKRPPRKYFDCRSHHWLLRMGRPQWLALLPTRARGTPTSTSRFAPRLPAAFVTERSSRAQHGPNVG